MYKIVMQEETHGKVKVPVQCKNVKMFPIEKGGNVVGFGKLHFVLLQVIIADNEGELRLKMSTAQGINYPKFTVQHPDTMEYPTYFVGQGKRRREYADTLAPKQRRAGEKEEYDLKGFAARLERLCGKELAGEILQLFANRFVEVMQKKAA